MHGDESGDCRPCLGVGCKDGPSYHWPCSQCARGWGGWGQGAPPFAGFGPTLKEFRRGCNKARVRCSAGLLKSVALSVYIILNTAIKYLVNKNHVSLIDRDW